MKKILIISCIALAVCTSLFLAFEHHKAQALSKVPFGGKIKRVKSYCCNGIELEIGPPKGGNFIVPWNAKIYANYQIYRPGPWVLGEATKGGVCFEIGYPPCRDRHQVNHTVTKIGTSF